MASRRHEKVNKRVVKNHLGMPEGTVGYKYSPGGHPRLGEQQDKHQQVDAPDQMQMPVTKNQVKTL